MKKVKKILMPLILALIVIPSYALAFDKNGVDYGNTGAGCGADEMSTIFGCVAKGPDSLTQFVKLTFNWVAGIIGSLAVIGLIWAAYTYITSGGNPDSLAKAKDIIWTSIASVIIIIFSYAFFSILGVI